MRDLTNEEIETVSGGFDLNNHLTIIFIDPPGGGGGGGGESNCEDFSADPGDFDHCE